MNFSNSWMSTLKSWISSKPLARLNSQRVRSQLSILMMRRVRRISYSNLSTHLWLTQSWRRKMLIHPVSQGRRKERATLPSRGLRLSPIINPLTLTLRKSQIALRLLTPQSWETVVTTFSNCKVLSNESILSKRRWSHLGVPWSIPLSSVISSRL